MGNPEYIVINDISIKGLSDRVTKHLKEGWTLSGNFAVVDKGGGTYQFYQPLYRNLVRSNGGTWPV